MEIEDWTGEQCESENNIGTLMLSQIDIVEFVILLVNRCHHKHLAIG
jgi:hypothetical protein